MSIQVLLFGALTEVTGETRIQLEANQFSNVAALHTFLADRYPGMEQQSFLYAVNQEIVSADHPIQSGDEVALLPPFSGG